MEKTLKIGVAAFMSRNFPGDKEGRYKNYLMKLKGYSQQLNFELFPVEAGIYTLDDALAASRKMAAAGVQFLLLHAASFADGALISPFSGLESTFLGVWAAPENEDKGGPLSYNSLCYGNLAVSTIKHYWRGYEKPVKWFYGSPDESLFLERFKVTIQALRAYYTLKGSRVAFIGGRAPGFDNLYVDEGKLYEKLGLTINHYEFGELHQLAREACREELISIMEEMKKRASLEAGMEEFLEKQARIVAATRRLTQESGCQAVALSCWPKFQTEMDCVACSAVGHLNETGLPTACEGDVLSAAGMLALKSITGRPVTLMDLVDIDEKDQSVLLWHCGPTAPSLAGEEGVTMCALKMLQRGLANDLTLKSGTAAIMGYTPDLKSMLVLQGEIDGKRPTNRGSGGWMKGLTLAHKPVGVKDLLETIFNSGYIHHYPLGYGELSQACLELAAWQGLKTLRPLTYKDHLI